MAHINANLPATVTDMFSIVKLSHQNYAEIETEFVKKHRGKLDGYWKVKKYDTDYHKLKFNNDDDNPLILIQGWIKFKEFHSFPENVEVQMMFHGNHIFEVMAVNELNCPIHIPSFHSRSHHPTQTAAFDLQLKNLDYGLNKLSLNDKFCDFLIHHNVQHLWVCGDNGEHYYMDVYNLYNDRRIMLGNNWDYVWESLNFKVGNTIRFKFEIKSNTVSKRCHLYKLS